MFGRKKTPPAPADDAPSSEAQLRFAPRSPSEAIKPTAAPPPPPRVRRRRGGILAALSASLTLLIAAAIGAGFLIGMLQREVSAPGPLKADKILVIPRNFGTNEIAALLQSEGVIRQPLLFEIYAVLNKQRGSLKAGEFLFKAGTTIGDAIDTLVQGKAIQHAITIPEGLTSEQALSRLAENSTLTGDVTEIPREGTLLPDTYRFERGETRRALISRMQASQQQALIQVWSRRSPDLPIKTPQELVILASLVEKETGRADERTRVAGVFINRLARRMKLQSDPTIVYGLVGGKGTLGRSILRTEIEKATPYNTYAIDGLPPGPITNPGRAALEAAANPLRTRDLYFVADGTGGHAFAETSEQHVRNVTRWRQVEKARQSEEASVDRVEPAALDAAPPAAASAFAPDQPPALRAPAAPAPGARAPAAATLGSPPPAGPVPNPRSPPSPAAGSSTPAAPAVGSAAPEAPGARRQAPRGRAVDASEGTGRDPLLNRTFDLNTQKTVPAVR